MSSQEAEPNNSEDAATSAPTPNDNETTHNADNDHKKKASSLSPLYLYGIPLLFVLVSFRRTSNDSSTATTSSILLDWLVWPLYQFAWTVLGISLGIALGLGLATHVYDQLTVWNDRQHNNNNNSSSRKNTATSNAIHPSSTTPSLHAADDYTSLMTQAGYATVVPTNHSTKVLRGSVVRADTPWVSTRRYDYTQTTTPRHHARTLFQQLWPALPTPVHEQLGYCIELIVRDFVACWFTSVDGGVVYEDPKEKHSKNTTNPLKTQLPRVMLYSLSPYRTSPFLDRLYESCVVLFGNLATRVEHVNVLQMVLLQWTRVLAHTFKVYRQLRKSALHKQRFAQQHARIMSNSSSQHNNSTRRSNTTSGRSDTISSMTASNLSRPPDSSSEATDNNNNQTATTISELSMTKEFLLADKLHRALTFGLDVPALLFADKAGHECGVPKNSSNNYPADDNMSPEDFVLAQRLYETPLLAECELDYNRVVAHRMVRALVTRQDYGSPMVSSLLTELMAGCVLSPIMSLFTPAYLNSWICQGLSSSGDNEHAQGEEPIVAADPIANNDQQESPQADFSEQSLEEKALEDLSENAALILSNSKDHANDATDMEAPSPTACDNIISLLALAIIDLQKHVDFEEYRLARSNNNSTIQVNWDDPGCRAAVLRLVLVVEHALTHGRCTFVSKRRNSQLGESSPSLIDNTTTSFMLEDGEYDEGAEESEQEVTLTDYEATTLSQILMEATSDPVSFEDRVATENTLAAERNANKYEDMDAIDYKPTPTEQSTVRTLIAAWLHTGQIYRMVSVLSQAHATILAPYYHDNAFLRSRQSAGGFVRQLRALEGVEVLVDTMTVLACPRLDETDNESLRELIQKATASSPTNCLAAGEVEEDSLPVTTITAAQLRSTSASPRYLDFHRNESFASSLRSERERRTQSWLSILAHDDSEAFVPVCRTKGASQEDVVLHRELHHIARIFYTGTNTIGIRDAARRKNSNPTEAASLAESSVASDDVHLSLLTVETASARRRIEVPDDDSSFLLRAQPRPLNAVGVYRDERNHDQSFKCFAATYEEPVPKAGTGHYVGGRFIRRCLIRYYPIDRTASIALQNDQRKLDQRKSSASVPNLITLDRSSRPAPFLSSDFLRDRHLCQRWVPKGTARSQSILASSVVEPGDFTAAPRPGKALDFIYKMAFFEKPMVDLSGKHFVVHDSPSVGMHRADASAIELSDASLSLALFMLGSTSEQENLDSNQQFVQMGKDGYPVIWMKFSRKQDDAQVEVKPYRVSFVRAALMVTAARQEAQLQCLVKCVRAGSAKKATKALTDARLKPTLRLIEYAGSSNREKQSILLRDLKLGVNHIDRAQLRRNGLLSPRFPTEILDLSAVVEDAVQVRDEAGDFFGASTTVYRIRCNATVRVDISSEGVESYQGYRRADGKIGTMFHEEWVVHRSFKEFQTLHKHLKGQVSTNMSSGTAGSRLVGAATAAFANTAHLNGRNGLRAAIIPSLSQASKAGALGVTKKSISRRKDILNEYIGYLLSPGNPLQRNSEILLFLAAFYPLPPSVRVGRPIEIIDDPLGRTEIKRMAVKENTMMKKSPSLVSDKSPQKEETPEVDSDDDEPPDEADSMRQSSRSLDTNPYIQAKVEKVSLSQVRNRCFELLRYQFGFENASFIRNRMLAALKTASFAVTSPSEFRKMLYKFHVEHLSGNSVAYWIRYGCDILWPNGVFFESAPPLTKEELDAQAAEAKAALHDNFPEQVRAILGPQLTRDGLDIFHEMLQNRVVMKSMAYMLFDILWLEVFPEIGDVLQCGEALDIDQ